MVQTSPSRAERFLEEIEAANATEALHKVYNNLYDACLRSGLALPILKESHGPSVRLNQIGEPPVSRFKADTLDIDFPELALPVNRYLKAAVVTKPDLLVLDERV